MRKCGIRGRQPGKCAPLPLVSRTFTVRDDVCLAPCKSERQPALRMRADWGQAGENHNCVGDVREVSQSEWAGSGGTPSPEAGGGSG